MKLMYSTCLRESDKRNPVRFLPVQTQTHPPTIYTPQIRELFFISLQGTHRHRDRKTLLFASTCSFNFSGPFPSISFPSLSFHLFPLPALPFLSIIFPFVSSPSLPFHLFPLLASTFSFTPPSIVLPYLPCHYFPYIPFILSLFRPSIQFLTRSFTYFYHTFVFPPFPCSSVVFLYASPVPSFSPQPEEWPSTHTHPQDLQMAALETVSEGGPVSLLRCRHAPSQSNSVTSPPFPCTSFLIMPHVGCGGG